jgi:hypothetical protein
MARGAWYIYVQTFFDQFDFVAQTPKKDEAERVAKVLSDRIKSESGCVCLVRVQRISQRDATLHALDDQIARNLERGRRGAPDVEAFGARVAAELLTPTASVPKPTRSESEIRRAAREEFNAELKAQLDVLDAKVQSLRQEKESRAALEAAEVDKLKLALLDEREAVEQNLIKTQREIEAKVAALKQSAREGEEAKAKLKELQAANGGGDFRPATWFPKGLAARLRQAASKNRKGKRVATQKIDGVVCYSVEDARRWWPNDVPKKA